MNFKKTQHFTDLLFSILLFCLFTASSALVLLFGSHIYTQISDAGQSNTQTRTTVNYIAEKVRQNDTENSIQVTEVEHLPALKIQHTYNHISYSTYIYAWDGSLREFTQRSQDIPQKEAGQIIAPASSLRIEQISEQLLLCTICDAAGKEDCVYVNIRCP